MAERDDRDEILRLRDRMHVVESKLVGIEMLVRQFELWRREADRELEGLVKADEIAEAVAEKMKSEHTLQLTFVQKAAAFVVGAVALAGAVKGLVG